jgi:predicted Zn-dependent protease
MRIAAPGIPAEKTYVVRPVERQEMRERLAELTLRTNRSPAAKLAMLGWSEARPGDVRLHEALGQEARTDGDADGARERWRQAIEAGTSNAAVFHELAQMEARRWYTRLDVNFRLPPERAAEFRTLLERSIAAAPDQSAAYETLAWVEATAEEPMVKNINLVQEHFATLVDKPRTLLAMASVRERRGDKGTALELLKALDAMEPGPQIATAAETLRAKLEGRKPRRLAPKGATPGMIPPSALPPIQAPVPNLPEKR